MSITQSISQPFRSMNYIPLIGQGISAVVAAITLSAALEALRKLNTIAQKRTKIKDQNLQIADSWLYKLPIINSIAKRVIPDQWRSMAHNAMPLMKNLGWTALFAGCATNHIPGTATLGLLLVATNPWTRTYQKTTTLPVWSACVLWTAICHKDSLYNLIPTVTRISRYFL